MGYGLDLAMQAGQQAVGAGMGLLIGGINDKRQLKQQAKLQKLQIAGAKEMGDYNYQKQLEMWLATNYPAQVEQMKKAGINPGLLLGMGGAGGTTTGSSGGGMPSGGQAPSGGGEIQGMTGMAIQLGLMNAQKENIEADTKLKEANAMKTSGVDTQEAETRIKSLMTGIDTEKGKQAIMSVEERLKKIEESFQNKTFQDRQDFISWQTAKALEELEIASWERYIAKPLASSKMEIVRQEAIGAALKNDLTSAQTDATKQGIEASKKGMEVSDAEIKKMAGDLINATRDLDRKDKEQAVDKWFKEAQIKLGITNTVLGTIKSVMGLK